MSLIRRLQQKEWSRRRRVSSNGQPSGAHCFSATMPLPLTPMRQSIELKTASACARIVKAQSDMIHGGIHAEKQGTAEQFLSELTLHKTRKITTCFQLHLQFYRRRANTIPFGNQCKYCSAKPFAVLPGRVTWSRPFHSRAIASRHNCQHSWRYRQRHSPLEFGTIFQSPPQRQYHWVRTRFGGQSLK